MEKGERELGSPETPPLRVGVSLCLLGASVRYDGGHKKDAFLTDTLWSGMPPARRRGHR